MSALYAGLAAEARNDFTAAKDAYNSYLVVGKTRSVRNDIRARLVALCGAQERPQVAVPARPGGRAVDGATSRPIAG